MEQNKTVITAVIASTYRMNRSHNGLGTQRESCKKNINVLLFIFFRRFWFKERPAIHKTLHFFTPKIPTTSPLL